MRSISNRDYVLKVVSHLFLVNGYTETSMDDVVKQSGVSKSNIYYHFKSKDDLAIAVLDGYIARLKNNFQTEIIAKQGTLIARLTNFTDRVFEELDERECVGGCPLLSMMVEAGKTHEEIRNRLQLFFQLQNEQIALLFEEGKKNGEIRSDLPTKTLASLLTSWLEGSLMLASIQKSMRSLQEERTALLHLLQASS